MTGTFRLSGIHSAALNTTEFNGVLANWKQKMLQPPKKVAISKTPSESYNRGAGWRPQANTTVERPCRLGFTCQRSLCTRRKAAWAVKHRTSHRVDLPGKAGDCAHVGTKGKTMPKLLSIMLLIVALASIGCASTGKAVAKLEPGMTKQQILDVLGFPADRSFRGSDEAWQYQEIAGFGQCKYTTVWISDGKSLASQLAEAEAWPAVALVRRRLIGARCLWLIGATAERGRPALVRDTRPVPGLHRTATAPCTSPASRANH